MIIVRDGRSHPPQILASDEWRFGEQVLAEPYIAGRELTCGVMGDKPLGVIEVKAATEWYDYDAKYAPGGPSMSSRQNLNQMFTTGSKSWR